MFLGLARAQGAKLEPDVAAQTALAKIERALPPADAKRIDVLLKTMTRSSQVLVSSPDPALMLTLAEAVNRRNVLDVRYSNGEGVLSRRTIHPYGLIAHSARWYLVAYDTASQKERTFRVDRVRSARLIPGTFTPPPVTDMAAHLVDLFADAEYRWRVVLRIRATKEHIRAHLPNSVAKLEPLDRASATGPNAALDSPTEDQPSQAF